MTLLASGKSIVCEGVGSSNQLVPVICFGGLPADAQAYEVSLSGQLSGLISVGGVQSQVSGTGRIAFTYQKPMNGTWTVATRIDGLVNATAFNGAVDGQGMRFYPAPDCQGELSARTLGRSAATASDLTATTGVFKSFLTAGIMNIVGRTLSVKLADFVGQAVGVFSGTDKAVTVIDADSCDLIANCSASSIGLDLCGSSFAASCTMTGNCP
jgi:hypothetical protein